MNEWGVVIVIVTLAGLIGAFVKPLIKLNTNLVENTMAIKAQTKTIQDNEIRNKEEHNDIWDKLDEHDGRISDIEKRGAN